MSVHESSATFSPPRRAGAAPPGSTYFAPAGRDSHDEFRRKRQAVQQASTALTPVLNAMPSMVMVLNQQRQIVSANDTMLQLLRATLDEVGGQRPGEALRCQWSHEGPEGCGTGQHCATCGAVEAILACQQQNAKVVRACRLSLQSPEGPSAMDLQVTASPLAIGQDQLILVAVADTSDAVRLKALQRTFFHDVLNTAGCIHGYSQYLTRDDSRDPEIFDRLSWLADRLVEDVQAHRDLVYAESGDLVVQPAELSTREVLEELRQQYRRHSVAEGRAVDVRAADGVIVTDQQLLLRVLGNMLKNALESTPVGGRVTLECVHLGANVEFSVHNEQVMPPEIQLQVFQRSFSTKERTGRGIGTFSMKLFGERYLGGKVRFSSRDGEGTRFFLTLPRQAPPPPPQVP